MHTAHSSRLVYFVLSCLTYCTPCDGASLALNLFSQILALKLYFIEREAIRYCKQKYMEAACSILLRARASLIVNKVIQWRYLWLQYNGEWLIWNGATELRDYEKLRRKCEIIGTITNILFCERVSFKNFTLCNKRFYLLKSTSSEKREIGAFYFLTTTIIASPLMSRCTLNEERFLVKKNEKELTITLYLKKKKNIAQVFFTSTAHWGYPFFFVK